MIAAIPLFVAGASDRLADLALNCLAVAGGYLAGHVFGGLVVWALDRWAWKKTTPEPFRRLVQIVCGLALAILVALIVFGRGGGSGGGTGEGDGKGTGSPAEATGKGDPPKADDKRPPVVVPPPKPADVDNSLPQVRVTFLGGDAAQPAAGRFYYLGDEAVPKTFDEVKAAVEAKKRDAAGKQVLLVVVYPADRTRAADERSRTVSQVTEWAERTGVRVVLGTGTK